MVAFSARYDIPIGADNLPKGTPWVQQVSKHAMDEEYEGWGPDVVALLKCMPEHPSKWFIHVVNPPIESYAKGKVAVLGDAVSTLLSLCECEGKAHRTTPGMGLSRRTACFHTWELVQVRVWKTLMS